MKALDHLTIALKLQETNKEDTSEINTAIQDLKKLYEELLTEGNNALSRSESEEIAHHFSTYVESPLVPKSLILTKEDNKEMLYFAFFNQICTIIQENPPVIEGFIRSGPQDTYFEKVNKAIEYLNDRKQRSGLSPMILPEAKNEIEKSFITLYKNSYEEVEDINFIRFIENIEFQARKLFLGFPLHQRADCLRKWVEERKINQAATISPAIRTQNILPYEIGNFKKITYLDLSQLPLQTLPESFGNLTKLNYLDLSKCQLRALPVSFRNLTKLRCLDLSNNIFLKNLPESFGDLEKIRNLNLSKCQLQTLPESFGNLSQLKYLNLSNNQLKIIPKFFGHFANLTELDLANNELNCFPQSFKYLIKLRKLNIQYNQFERLPKFFAKLTNLENLEWI